MNDMGVDWLKLDRCDDIWHTRNAWQMRLHPDVLDQSHGEESGTKTEKAREIGLTGIDFSDLS